MFIIEATRRASRTAATRVLNALVEYDSIVFKDVEIAPEAGFEVVKQGRTYVVALNDPTIEEPTEDFGRDCFD